MRFSGRRAVVTGGASGIGEAVAKRLAAEGGNVAVWDLNGGIKVDISDFASVEKAVKETVNQIGGIDILVNSAGITGPTVPLMEFPIDGWKQVIDINLNGTFYCNRAVAPLMVAQNYGRIVNIASIAAKYPLELRILSGAPRAALVNYTGAVARRVAADNVTLNTVLPGMFHTAFVHEQFTENARRNGTSYEQEVAKFTEAYQIPAKRFGDPRDVGSLVAWLCSEFAGYITGQSIAVDGAATRSTF